MTKDFMSSEDSSEEDIGMKLQEEFYLLSNLNGDLQE